MRNIFKLFTFLLFAPGVLSAQCVIEQLVFNTSAPVGTEISASNEIGQTFTACQTGDLTTIMVKISSTMSAPVPLTLKIAEGVGTVSPATVLHTQLVTVNAAGDVTFTLDTPVRLTNGQVYTFSFIGMPASSATIQLSSTTGDNYAGGTFLLNNAPLSPDVDLFFRVALAAPPPVEPIPTMSQWGLLIFGLLIMNLSVFLIGNVQRIRV